ncbi:hypothetical protein LshimejAT787_0604700 [Lyophyllum shimeji]|uniref:Uncharacterized protein n=1 Tax=Lyophyllum shimeji TaxID=47721 RepID=A0A9P3UN51_LYOSH|nr:hypothetical protein LshimejAT787_0604700 [Lyophyllum shimeji]
MAAQHSERPISDANCQGGAHSGAPERWNSAVLSTPTRWQTQPSAKLQQDPYTLRSHQTDWFKARAERLFQYLKGREVYCDVTIVELMQQNHGASAKEIAKRTGAGAMRKQNGAPQVTSGRLVGSPTVSYWYFSPASTAERPTMGART